jgi:hypothetical protein
MIYAKNNRAQGRRGHCGHAHPERAKKESAKNYFFQQRPEDDSVDDPNDAIFRGPRKENFINTL